MQTFYQSFFDERSGERSPDDVRRVEELRRSVQRRRLSVTRSWITVQFTLLTVAFEFVLGLGIALVVNSNFKGRGPMRAAMLVPWAIPTVVSAQIWKWMYEEQFGVLNDLVVQRLHFFPNDLAFIADTATSVVAVAAVDIWKTTPFMALLLLAGLQVIPTDMYEAPTSTGQAIEQFSGGSLAALRPAIVVALIFRTLDALRVFDVFYVLFGNRVDTRLWPSTTRDRSFLSGTWVRHRDQRRDLLDHRPLRRHVCDLHQGREQ